MFILLGDWLVVIVIAFGGRCSSVWLLVYLVVLGLCYGVDCLVWWGLVGFGGCGGLRWVVVSLFAFDCLVWVCVLHVVAVG